MVLQGIEATLSRRQLPLPAQKTVGQDPARQLSGLCGGHRVERVSNGLQAGQLSRPETTLLRRIADRETQLFVAVKTRRRSIVLDRPQRLLYFHSNEDWRRELQ